MTTFFPFTPALSGRAPTFQPTLDGSVYTITVNWNLYGQRYYLLCIDQTGVLGNIINGQSVVFNVAMIESPPSQPISNLVFNPASLTVDVTTVNPHGFAIGSTTSLTIANSVPTGFNGAFDMLAVGPNDLTFPLAAYPGVMQAAGSLSQLISMTQGYFDSTLVYRNSNFEVSP